MRKFFGVISLLASLVLVICVLIGFSGSRKGTDDIGLLFIGLFFSAMLVYPAKKLLTEKRAWTESSFGPDAIFRGLFWCVLLVLGFILLGSR